MITTWHEKLVELYAQMVEWRRYFHQYPELSYEEVETPKKIAEILKSFDIEVRTSVGERGVVGMIRGGKASRGGHRHDSRWLPGWSGCYFRYSSSIYHAVWAGGR